MVQPLNKQNMAIKFFVEIHFTYVTRRPKNSKWITILFNTEIHISNTSWQNELLTIFSEKSRLIAFQK